MAHVVGVPNRDPCRKCQLPVFLAERLMVGKKVYHRTCLKCARCGYQLTPGSFYETEVDDQYCCETCPDEEASSQQKCELLPKDSETETAAESSNVEYRNKFDQLSALRSPTKTVRSSIKERLAFFENQREREDDTDTKLLQKSLSDEEKSNSLQRMENSPGAVLATYKPNAAFSSFLNDTVDNDQKDQSEDFSFEQHLEMETSSSEDEETDDLTNVSLPPELPKSLPPLIVSNADENAEETKRFTAQLVLGSLNDFKVEATKESDKQQQHITELNQENQTEELQISISSSLKNDKSNNNINIQKQIVVSSFVNENFGEQRTQETFQSCQNKVENNLELSTTNDNDNDCVTKDKSADDFIKETTTEALQYLESAKDGDEETKSIELSNSEIKRKIDYTENKSNKLRTNSDENFENTLCPAEDTKTTQRLSVVRARLQQFEVNTNSEEIINNDIIINNEEVLNNNNNNTSDSVVEDTVAIELLKKNSNESLTENKINNIENKTESLNLTLLENKVPLDFEAKDNKIVISEVVDNEELSEKNKIKDKLKDDVIIPQKTPTGSKTTIKDYPENLNPFKSDEEDEVTADYNKENFERKRSTPADKENLNPFDSSDDEIELNKMQNSKISSNLTSKVPPPRPPPPRVSKNPFGSEDEDDTSSTQTFCRRSSLTGSQSRKTPVPTPRSNISQSQNPTPEPTPRLSTKANTAISPLNTATPNNSPFTILQNSSDLYGSANSLHSNNVTTHNLLRNSDIRSSNNSLNLSAGGTIRSRKSRRAPLPPAPVKELFPSNETIYSGSKTSTPSSSTVGTPKSARKKRPAPAPPKPARLDLPQVPQAHINTTETKSKNLNSYPLQSELDSKLSDEEKALLEGNVLELVQSDEPDPSLAPSSSQSSKRLIPLDKELLEEHGREQYVEGNISQCDDLKQQHLQKSIVPEGEEISVVYRRRIIPQNLETPTHEYNSVILDATNSPSLGERQLEKLKDNKEANNRNRQSQISVASSGTEDNDPLFNKSTHGKWKRRKGPAPALPIPPRKVLQMLPLQEIKHELEIIEVQQQGLEKQGVILEKMIRDRCEGENGEPLKTNESPGKGEYSSADSTNTENSKEVENLILQLFELVNEKNELFRRQAELMYLRRQHRLEQEQADLEYEIRILMAQPERNKTDSDKAREEDLIERLVEVVQLRNEVVECLEMDRIREAEEDQSIKQRLESHIAKREDDSDIKKSLTKLSKKEKKKQKEAKKLSKNKKIDADKDADESELLSNKLKSKKKKKLLIF